MSRTPFWVRNLGAFWVLNSKNVDIKGFLKSHALRVPRGSFGEDPGNLEKSRFPGFFIVLLEGSDLGVFGCYEGIPAWLRHFYGFSGSTSLS